MSWDEDSAEQWAAQELCERRRFEEEQEALRADPAFDEWLVQLELKHEKATI